MPTDWSPDGRFVLYRDVDPKTGFDLWILPVSGDKKPFPFARTPFNEREGQFSPDGKWVAYQSDESGRFEIYVQACSGANEKVRISNNGGAQVRWNKKGTEIFDISLDGKMMAVTVKLSADARSVEAGTPVALFPVHIVGGPVPSTTSNKQQYAVSSDGQRFLINSPADQSSTSPITLIYNWKSQAAE